MLKKHLILIGVLISLTLFIIATLYYPGGSYFNKTSVGFGWKTNFISNLFAEKAVNGLHNGGRFWAVGGMVFLSASFALFFIRFSKKIPVNAAANVIKYIGVMSMLCAFLVATPLHDIMVIIASTLFLIGMFYITVFILNQGCTCSNSYVYLRYLFFMVRFFSMVLAIIAIFYL